jgi:hypothetical protein
LTRNGINDLLGLVHENYLTLNIGADACLN